MNPQCINCATDSQRFPPAEARLQPNDSESNHGTLAGNDDFALSEEIDDQERHNDSILPSSLESQVHRFFEQNPATADATAKNITYDSWATTDEAPELSLGTDDAVSPDSNVTFEKRAPKVSVSSGTENLSELSWEGGSESPGSVKPLHLNAVCSDCDSGVSELDKESVGISDVPGVCSSDNDSDVTGKRRKPPVIVPWKECAVGKSEIPSSIFKPSKSDVSDLGDRYSYEKLNASGRKFTIALDDTYGQLALQDRFFEALVRPHEEKKGFFPRALLSTLVTNDCVFDELSRCLKDTHNPNQIQAYADTICEECRQPPDGDDSRPPKVKSFKKIFAILVLIEKTSSIPKFLDEDLNDLHLPLNKLLKGNNGSRFELRLSSDPSKRLESFGNWSPFFLKAFEEWQWTTVSPFFYKGSCKDVEHWPLQPSIMLPFTMDGRRGKQCEYGTEIEGGYSRVFKAEIHQDHHSFDIPKNQCFAIKRLNTRSKEDFKKEVEMLKMFSDDTRYPHLISLLATYEQLGFYFLVFPWADGDLNMFWRVQNPTPCFDMETVKWVAKQCEGIAHGLVKIHHYQTSNSNCQTDCHHHDEPHERRYGRHGDMKPENILWFSGPDGGILKISDFGLSEYSTIHSKSYKPKSRVATSMSYRPPECDLKGGKIGQSYDIWTLGCLYLEFITWLLGGWKLVKDFETKRMAFDPMWYDMFTDTFFEILECPNSNRPGAFAARVKPPVKNFMEHLHAHESCTEFLHDFINMIQLDMLIVKPNDPNERGRITSDEVNVKLTAMLKKCENPENGPDYVCKPAPWSSPSQNNDDPVEIDIIDSPAEVLSHKRFRHYNGPIHERSYSNTLAVPGSPGKRGSSYSSHH